MVAASNEVRVEDLAAHPHLIEQVALLRWNEWAYGDPDPTRFVEVSRAEAGDGEHLPLTLVAVDASGRAVGVVGLGTIDSELDEIERATRTPWILGMVVARDARRLGVGRLLLTGIHEATVRLGQLQTWVATGEEAVGFYARCGWEAVESVRLRSTGINTTILVKPARASDRPGARLTQSVGSSTIKRRRDRRRAFEDLPQPGTRAGEGDLPSWSLRDPSLIRVPHCWWSEAHRGGS